MTDFAFTLESPQLRDGFAEEQLYNSMGCRGGNVSPELRWSEPPEGTQSLALTLYDPDAPTGSGWWHWVVFNIPPDVRSLPKGAGSLAGTGLPQGAVQSRTDFGMVGYGGPCPPVGDAPHRYQFTVHALNVPALKALDAEAMPAQVGFALRAASLGRARLEVRHGR